MRYGHIGFGFIRVGEPAEAVHLRPGARRMCGGLPTRQGRRLRRITLSARHRPDAVSGDTGHRRVVVCQDPSAALATTLTGGRINDRKTTRGGRRPGQMELGRLVGQSGSVWATGFG